MTLSMTLGIALAAWLAPADARLHQPANQPSPGAFTFVRIEYDSEGGYGEAYYNYDGRFWHRWQTDYPEAEENLLFRLAELTVIPVNPEPISLRLTNKNLFKYPFIYMSDVGWQRLSKNEIDNLREYLNRGGFLWVDDFWGDGEWNNFEYNMQKVFPEKRWRRIPNDHPILNIVFPLEECPQIPAKSFWERSGLSHDPPNVHRAPSGGIEGVNSVNFLGLFDDDGRLMVMATHNSDLADGWEREAEDSRYFELFSVKAYAFSVNVIAYIMTH